MKCYCCSVKKKLFESFAELNTDFGVLYLCSACNDLLYKIRDDVADGNESRYKKHCNALKKRENTPNDSYVRWVGVFLENNQIVNQ